MESVHNEADDYNCGKFKCVLFDFSSPSKLLLHKHEMEAHHKNGSKKVHEVQKVKCWQCDVICSTKTSLAKHLRFVHNTKNECADKEETAMSHEYSGSGSKFCIFSSIHSYIHSYIVNCVIMP